MSAVSGKPHGARPPSLVGTALPDGVVDFLNVTKL
jgi:hypothetical protein